MNKILTMISIALCFTMINGCTTTGKKILEDVKNEVTEIATEVGKDVKKIAVARIEARVDMAKLQIKDKIKDEINSARKNLQEKVGFKLYRTREGDSYSEIAYREYRDQFLWPAIWYLNKDLSGTDPNKLEKDEFLYIPLLKTLTEDNRVEATNYAKGFGEN